MLKFSANLGFLWTDETLPDAIARAGNAGFDAVECHMPYTTPASETRRALDNAGLQMVSLNTRIGDSDGDLGVAAVPGREVLARSYIDEAVDYAAQIGCAAVSVVAGKTGRTEEAESTYRQNLTYAVERACEHNITVLIEPLNARMCSDYHLVSADRGVETIRAIGAPNLKLMIDYFHLCVMENERRPVIERVVSDIGHFQFASIPDRNEPDLGTVDYSQLLPWIVAQGYDGVFGAEYVPATGVVEAGLDWMQKIRKEDS